MKELAIAVEKSGNAKTGIVHATYAAQTSCPSDCVLQGAGCYAESGPIAITTRRLNKVAEMSKPIDVAFAEAAAIRSLSGTRDLRIHVVGDCRTSKTADVVSSAALETLKPGRQPWSYTHAWRRVDPKAWNGVSVLASVEKPEQVEEAQDHGWATAIVVEKFDDNKLYKLGNAKVLPCVNQTHGKTCVECRLCFDAERLHGKGITIGFETHGARRKVAARSIQK